jgi:sortase A
MDPRNQSQDDDNEQPVTAPQRDHQFATPDRKVAAQYIREQIDAIYDDNPPNQTNEQREAHQVKAQEPQNPYKRTHDPDAITHVAPERHADNQWQRYHQAWQQYYQQYYHRYYMHHMIKEKQRISTGGAAIKSAAPEAIETQQEGVFSEAPGGMGRRVASDEIKDELLGKIKAGAGRARHSTHFMPIISAVVVGMLFIFLQYNRVFIAQVHAYISPGSANPQSIILDPTTELKVGKEPRLIIPKINVDAPVVYDVGSIAEPVIQKALEDGVVHYPIPGANSVPGQAGNSVIVGHSSNDVFDSGDYKFVFVLLDRLQKGDVFYMHYNGLRYTYSVTDKKVIDPSDIGELTVRTDKPMATLLTCTPPGTSLKRLLVFAEQISPDPAAAKKAPSGGTIDEPAELPSNSPSVFQRLFN